MWSRSYVKERGRSNLDSSYTSCILVTIVLLIATQGINTITSIYNNFQINLKYELNFEYGYIIDYYFSLFMLWFLLIAFILRILIGNSLEIGAMHFYLDTQENGRCLRNLFFSFRSGHYLSHTYTLFKRDLFIFFWSLLFIIPGIIKSYEYRMVPYLLASHPELTATEAFERSQYMMSGEKWDTFVLDVSFIGWWILSSVTCGLAGIFFVNPYYYCTRAELYKILSD